MLIVHERFPFFFRPVRPWNIEILCMMNRKIKYNKESQNYIKENEEKLMKNLEKFARSGV